MLDEILYVEADRNYCKIFTVGQTYLIVSPMNKLCEKKSTPGVYPDSPVVRGQFFKAGSCGGILCGNQWKTDSYWKTIQRRATPDDE